MTNISKFCIDKNNYGCQPLREKKTIDRIAFKSEKNETVPVTVNDQNVQKFGAKFYQACNELKGLFPYLTAKESAALIWDRMKSNNPKNS